MGVKGISVKGISSATIKKLLRYWYIPLIVLLLIVLRNFAFLALMFFMAVSTLLVSAYRLVINADLGLELISFYSIILSIAASPTTGIAFAATMLVLTAIIQARLCSFLIIKMVVYTLICIAAPMLAPLGIVQAGIILIILKNIAFMVITYSINPARVLADLPGNVVNIVLNIVLFSTLGRALVLVL